MRSIGKKNKNLVRRLTKELIESGDYSYSQITDIVIQKLPEELWNSWEMADQEIRNLITETIQEE